MKKALIIAGVIVILATLSFSVYWFNRQPVTQSTAPEPQGASSTPAFEQTKYRNASFGYELTYPNEYRMLSGEQDIQSAGYIPPCDPKAATCLFLSSDFFGKTNFGGAGLGVNILENTDETKCMNLLTADSRIQPHEEVVNGVKFKVAGEGDAAMSHQMRGTLYRTFHNGICYELEKRINTSSFEVYESGTIDRFTDTEEQEVQASLDSILQSFRFD